MSQPILLLKRGDLEPGKVRKCEVGGQALAAQAELEHARVARAWLACQPDFAAQRTAERTLQQEVFAAGHRLADHADEPAVVAQPV